MSVEADGLPRVDALSQQMLQRLVDRYDSPLIFLKVLFLPHSDGHYHCFFQNCPYFLLDNFAEHVKQHMDVGDHPSLDRIHHLYIQKPIFSQPHPSVVEASAAGRLKGFRLEPREVYEARGVLIVEPGYPEEAAEVKRGKRRCVNPIHRSWHHTTPFQTEDGFYQKTRRKCKRCCIVAAQYRKQHRNLGRRENIPTQFAEPVTTFVKKSSKKSMLAAANAAAASSSGGGSAPSSSSAATTPTKNARKELSISKFDKLLGHFGSAALPPRLALELGLLSDTRTGNMVSISSVPLFRLASLAAVPGGVKVPSDTRQVVAPHPNWLCLHRCVLLFLHIRWMLRPKIAESVHRLAAFAPHSEEAVRVAIVRLLVPPLQELESRMAFSAASCTLADLREFAEKAIGRYAQGVAAGQYSDEAAEALALVDPAVAPVLLRDVCEMLEYARARIDEGAAAMGAAIEDETVTADRTRCGICCGVCGGTGSPPTLQCRGHCQRVFHTSCLPSLFTDANKRLHAAYGREKSRIAARIQQHKDAGLPTPLDALAGGAAGDDGGAAQLAAAGVDPEQFVARGYFPPSVTGPGEWRCFDCAAGRRVLRDAEGGALFYHYTVWPQRCAADAPEALPPAADPPLVLSAGKSERVERFVRAAGAEGGAGELPLALRRKRRRDGPDGGRGAKRRKAGEYDDTPEGQQMKALEAVPLTALEADAAQTRAIAHMDRSSAADKAGLVYDPLLCAWRPKSKTQLVRRAKHTFRVLSAPPPGK